MTVTSVGSQTLRTEAKEPSVSSGSSRVRSRGLGLESHSVGTWSWLPLISRNQLRQREADPLFLTSCSIYLFILWWMNLAHLHTLVIVNANPSLFIRESIEPEEIDIKSADPGSEISFLWCLLRTHDFLMRFDHVDQWGALFPPFLHILPPFISQAMGNLDGLDSEPIHIVTT